MTEEILPSRSGIDLGSMSLSEEEIWLAKAIPVFLLPYIDREARRKLLPILEKGVNTEKDIRRRAEEIFLVESTNTDIVTFKEILKNLPVSKFKEVKYYLEEYKRRADPKYIDQIDTILRSVAEELNIKEISNDLLNIYRKDLEEILNKVLYDIDNIVILPESLQELRKAIENILNELKQGEFTKEKFEYFVETLENYKKAIENDPEVPNEVYLALYCGSGLEESFKDTLNRIKNTQTKRLVTEENINALEIALDEVSNGLKNISETFSNDYRILQMPSEHSKIITSILFITKNKNFGHPEIGLKQENTLDVLKQDIQKYLQTEYHKDFLGYGYRHTYATTSFDEIKAEANSIFKESKIVLPLRLKSLDNLEELDYEAIFNEIKEFLIEIFQNLMPYLRAANNEIDEEGFENLKRDIFNLRFEIKNLDKLDLSEEEKSYINEAISDLIDIGILAAFGGTEGFVATVSSSINSLIKGFRTDNNINKLYNNIDKDIENLKNNHEPGSDRLDLLLDEIKSATWEALKTFADKVALPFISVLGTSAALNIATNQLTGGKKYYDFYYYMANQPFIKTTFGPYFWAASIVLIGSLYAISKYRKTKRKNQEIKKKLKEEVKQETKTRKPLEVKSVPKHPLLHKLKKHFF